MTDSITLRAAISAVAIGSVLWANGAYAADVANRRNPTAPTAQSYPGNPNVNAGTMGPVDHKSGRSGITNTPPAMGQWITGQKSAPTISRAGVGKGMGATPPSAQSVGTTNAHSWGQVPAWTTAAQAGTTTAPTSLQQSLQQQSAQQPSSRQQQLVQQLKQQSAQSPAAQQSLQQQQVLQKLQQQSAQGAAAQQSLPPQQLVQQLKQQPVQLQGTQQQLLQQQASQLQNLRQQPSQ